MSSSARQNNNNWIKDPLKQQQYLAGYRVTEWLNSETISQVTSEKLATFLFIEDTNFPAGKALSTHVQSKGRQEGEVYYGKNFPMLTPLTTAMLSQCKNAHDEGTNINLIELGAGWGLLVWKELLANCYTTAIEITLNESDTKGKFDRIVSSRVPPEKLIHLTTISEDFFNIYNSRPEILHSFNIVSTHNVLHLFAPETSNKFLQLIDDLLLPGGRVYITVNNLASQLLRYKSCHEVYLQNIAERVEFPGFIYSETVVNKHTKYPISIICKSRDEEPIPNITYIDHKLIYEDDNIIQRNGYGSAYTLNDLKKLFIKKDYKIIRALYVNEKGVSADESVAGFVSIEAEKPCFNCPNDLIVDLTGITKPYYDTYKFSEY